VSAGHTDPSITLRVYSHAIEQRDQELAARLGATFAAASGFSQVPGAILDEAKSLL
jgi:hypothetical protein